MRQDRNLSIIASVTARGEAAPVEISADLARSGFVVSALTLRQTLGRLVRQGYLVRLGYARYAVSPDFGQSIFLSVEQATRARIEQVLRREGGVMENGDIHRALWAGPGERLVGWDYQHVRMVLTKHFRRNFGRKNWNLPMEELAGVPLAGRWGAARLDPGERGAFFERVGEAFLDAREELSLADVIKDPAIQKALEQMSGVGAVRNAVREEMGKLPQDQDKMFRVVWLLFEAGRAAVHMAARADFYHASATRFGVGAAALSRGEVEKIVES